MATFTIRSDRKFYRSSVTQLALRTVVGLLLVRGDLENYGEMDAYTKASYAYAAWLAGDASNKGFADIAAEIVQDAKTLKRAPKRNAKNLALLRIAYVAMTEKDALRAVLRIAELRGDAKDKVLSFAEGFLVRAIRNVAAKRKAS